MVVFVDLEGDDTVSEDHSSLQKIQALRQRHPSELKLPSRTKPPNLSNPSSFCRDRHAVNDHAASAQNRPNPNLGVVSEALGCYPVITILASYIDLNTLHALSRTCRQVRANLIQYRNRLVQQTLRCSNEVQDGEHLQTTPAGGQHWHILGEAGHIVSGKVSSCARDLVSDCRRCGRIVCRNCTIKPPSSSRLPHRLRRLCRACLTAPLPLLASNRTSTSPVPSSSTTYSCSEHGPLRDPCSCASRGVHLCVPCGAKLAEADTTYTRIWTWRTRYTTYLGGLGTGVGEGNEGVHCARGAECLGALEVEAEFECPFSPDSTNSHEILAATAAPTTLVPQDELAGKDEPGYLRQEVEGLGGVVKKKFRKRERVGATVREWEDESRGGEILGREKEGGERAWCGWCSRVVLPIDR